MLYTKLDLGILLCLLQKLQYRHKNVLSIVLMYFY